MNLFFCRRFGSCCFPDFVNSYFLLSLQLSNHQKINWIWKDKSHILFIEPASYNTVSVSNPDVRISAFSKCLRLWNCPDFEQRLKSGHKCPDFEPPVHSLYNGLISKVRSQSSESCVLDQNRFGTGFGFKMFKMSEIRTFMSGFQNFIRTFEIRTFVYNPDICIQPGRSKSRGFEKPDVFFVRFLALHCRYIDK